MLHCTGLRKCNLSGTVAAAAFVSIHAYPLVILVRHRLLKYNPKCLAAAYIIPDGKMHTSLRNCRPQLRNSNRKIIKNVFIPQINTWGAENQNCVIFGLLTFHKSAPGLIFGEFIWCKGEVG